MKDYDLENSWYELSSIILQVFDDKCPITKNIQKQLNDKQAKESY